MISDDRAEKAVEFLRDHADRVGQLYGRCKALDEERKTVKGQAFIESEGTVAEREARSYVSAEYKAIVEEIRNAWADYRTAELKLKAAELTISVWQTQNANARRGHVL